MSSPWRVELSALMRLAAPVCLGQVGLFAMGVVDTMMVGRVSQTAIAAVAIGNLYSFAFLGAGFGVLHALDPVIAQALGARDDHAVSLAVQRGLLLSIVLCLPVGAVLLASEPVLELLRQPPEIVPTAAAYVRITILSAPAYFAFTVFRQTLQAEHRLRPVIVGVLVTNVVNVVLNWMLVFGHGGFEAMGPVGSAWATVGSRWCLAALLLVAGWERLVPRLVPPRRRSLRLRPLWRLFSLGLPLGLQHLVEIATFSGVALFMGWIGVTELAAHHVALNLGALAFMVPLGLSAAAAVRVGHAVGREDPDGARLAAHLALGVAALVMAAAAVVFAVAPWWLARAFTTDAAVLAVGVVLLRVAAVFQVFDGLQVVAMGILRGVGDTRAPLVVNVVGFWAIGIPASLWLGFRTPLGAAGLWWGLVVGLFAVATFLIARVQWRLGRQLDRVILDE